MPKDIEIKEKTREKEDGLLDSIPVNRITSYKACQMEYERALPSHVGMAQVWARIVKLFSGVPPYNKQKLKELGQGHTVNTDWGTARSKLQKAITSYYNIFYKNKFLAEITVEITPELTELLGTEDVGSLDSSSTRDWSQIITEEWTYSKRLVWKKYFFDFISSHLKELMLFGVNHIFFSKVDDPRPESGTVFAHYSPSDAYVDVDRNDIHIIKHEYSVFELLEFYMNDKSSSWDKGALSEVLHEVISQMDLGITDTLPEDSVGYLKEIIDRMARHAHIGSSFNNTTVEVASLYVKEFAVKDRPAGISRVIFTPHLEVSGPIFFKDREYEKLSDVLIISTLLPGEERKHDCKGLGQISYGHLLEMSKLKCTFATNLKVDSTTFMVTESGSAGDIRKVRIPVGGMSVIPETIKIQPQKTGTASSNSLAGLQYLEQDLDKNSLFILNSASSDTAPASAIQQRAKEAVEMQQNNLAHYMLSTLDELYSLIFKKELQFYKKTTYGAKLAKKFVAACVRRGVPEDLFKYTSEVVDEITGLPTWFKITSYKGTGTGSQIGDVLKVQDAYTFNIPQKLKSRGAQYFREWEAAAVLGQEAVPHLYPPEDIADDPTYMATMASLVANDLEEGKLVAFSPDLDHEVFASILLERMQQVADRYLQQPPTGIAEFKQQEREILFETDIALQSIGSFLALHLTYLAQDPSKQPLFKNILPLFNRLEGLSQGIHANAEKARDAQAREKAQEDANNNAAMQKVIFENERKTLDVQLSHIRKMFDAKGSFSLKLIQAREEGKIARFKAVSEAQAKLIEVQAKKSLDSK